MSAIVGPIPPFSNPPIHPEYYVPGATTLTAITRGKTTTITTSAANNLVVGQLVRFNIPFEYGIQQLNGRSGYVISVTSTTQAVVDIDSSAFDAFVVSPYTANITGITQSLSPVTVTADNPFVPGNFVLFEDVEGMTEINGLYGYVISANASSFTVDLNTLDFSAYTMGGTASSRTSGITSPKIVAIGDVNSGIPEQASVTSIDNIIPGSFHNIS